VLGREVAALIPQLKEMRQRYNQLLMINMQLKGKFHVQKKERPMKELFQAFVL
jgi:hypothetical protein